MELALPLLPLIAPDVAAPIAYRDGDEPPRFVQVAAAELVAAAVREASAEAAREGRAALIAPAKLLPELPAQAETRVRRAGGAVPDADAARREGPRVRPRRARRAGRDRGEGAERIEGLRALYVALTRATKTLVVVHARPLPPELAPVRTAMSGV